MESREAMLLLGETPLDEGGLEVEEEEEGPPGPEADTREMESGSDATQEGDRRQEKGNKKTRNLEHFVRLEHGLIILIYSYIMVLFLP